MEQQLKCKACGQTKPETKYHKHSSYKTGRRSTCIKCANDPKKNSNYSKQVIGDSWCSGCKIDLDVSKFNKDTRRKNGLQASCRDCQKKHRNRNKQRAITSTITSKKCNICDLLLGLDKFSKSSTGILGKRNDCKDCVSTKRYNTTKPRVQTGEKYCPGCKDDLDVSEFNADKYGKMGLQTYCKECFIEIKNKTLSILTSFIKNKLKDAYHNAKQKRKKVTVNITADDILDLYHEQDGKCAITGMEMTHISRRREAHEKEHIINKYNISIDRIDSNGNYAIDNIQLVCAIINRIKYDLEENTFLDLCDEIVEYNKYRDEFDNDELLEDINWKAIIANTIHNQNNRSKDIKFNVTEDELDKLYVNQEGMCDLSGNIMTYKGGTCISIDRINSDGDYAINNIQLVCGIVNNMKSDLTNDKFIKLCDSCTS
jgi:hypothetical protein